MSILSNHQNQVNDTSSSLILKTKDYSIFKIPSQQRKLLEDNSLLEQSILQHNALSSKPIIVDSNMFVLDGQHRLQVAKKHNLEIYYIVDPTLTAKDIPLLQKQRAWKKENYINFYAAYKFNHYEKLVEFINDNKDIEPSLIIWFTVDNFANISKDMQEGKYTTIYNHRDPELYQKLNYFREVREEIFKIYKDQKKPNLPMSFKQAIWCIITCFQYDHSKFLKRLVDRAFCIEPIFKIRTLTDAKNALIERIYDWNEKNEKRINKKNSDPRKI